MADFLPGRIVRVKVPDRNGFVKDAPRPAIVLSAAEDAAGEVELVVVAVSSTLPDVLPDDQIELPWHPQGHPWTGFRRRCAAICRWLLRIPASAVVERGKVLRAKSLHAIVAAVDRLAREDEDG